MQKKATVDEEFSEFLTSNKAKPCKDVSQYNAAIVQLMKLLDNANPLNPSLLLQECHIKLLTLCDQRFGLIRQEERIKSLPSSLPIYLHSLGFLKQCNSAAFDQFAENFVVYLKKLDNNEALQTQLFKMIEMFYTQRDVIVYFPADEHFQNLILGKIGSWIGRFPAYKRLQLIQTFPYIGSIKISVDIFLDEMLTSICAATSDTDLIKNNVRAAIDYCNIQRPRIDAKSANELESILLRILVNALKDPHPLSIFELTQRFQKQLDNNNLGLLIELMTELLQKGKDVAVGYLIAHFNLRQNDHFSACVKAYDIALLPKQKALDEHSDLIQDLEQRYLVYLVTSDSNVPNETKITLLTQNFDRLRQERTQLRADNAGLRVKLENRAVATSTLGGIANRAAQEVPEIDKTTSTLK